MNLEFSIQYFLWLASMTPSLMFYIWPMTLVLVIFSVVCWLNWVKLKVKPRPKWVWLVSTCSIALLILFYGTLHRAGEKSQPQSYSELAIYIVSAILLLQVTLSILAIYQTRKNARLLSASILAWGFYFSFSASFITLMSVSGRWL